MNVQEESVFDRITSRHIAKLLSRIEGTVAPVVVSEIKRQMRFLTEDILQASENTEERANEKRLHQTLS